MYTFFTALFALYSTASGAYIGRPWDARAAIPAYDTVQRDNAGGSARVGTVYPRTHSDEARMFLPLRSRHFDYMTGVQRRAVSDEDALAPGKHARMMWGKVQGTKQLAMANMTLHATDDLPVAMIEEFDHLTSNIDCQGDDGQMSLKFRSESAYNAAVKKWAYLNDGTGKQFLMVANHPGCGNAGQRKPYRITKVDMAPEKLTTFLAAEPASWKQVASAFDMNFGKFSVDDASANRLRARGRPSGGFVRTDKDIIAERDLFDAIGDGIDAIGEGIDALTGGSGNFTKSVDLPVSIGEPNDPHLLFEDFTRNPPRLKLTCSSCFAKGTFEASGSIVVDDFKPKALRVQVSPKQFTAEVNMTAEIAQRNDDHKFSSFEKTLFEAQIPGAGIDIPEIFSLGAHVEFNVQAKALLIGQATVNLGGKTTVPDDASLTLDLINFDQSGADGFENTQVEPIFELGKASITATFLAGPSPAIALGATILDDQGLEAKMSFGTPTLNLNVTAGFDNQGFCAPGDAITSGFKVQSAANFDMSLNVDAKAGTSKTSLFERKLVNIPLATFLNKCFPVDGLTPLNQEPTNQINGTNSTDTADTAKFRRFMNE